MISATSQITVDDFMRVDMRIGTIIDAAPFPEARKPAIRMKIDLGTDVGIKSSSAQITGHYSPEALVGQQVLCVVNFPPRQIGPMISEVLTLGFYDDNKDIVLARPDMNVPNGARLI